VDSTLPTPYLARPLNHDADIVVHSTTKFLAGHGNAIGGIVVYSGRFEASECRSARQYRR
jgi:O-acetylhomoserine (thiol)-lyase